MQKGTAGPLNTSVVIRTVSERTEQLCYRLLCQQIPPENISIVHEAPFAKAVQKTFEIGLDKNLPWTLAVDADILIAPNVINQLLAIAEQADPKVFKFGLKVLDKFFGGLRYAGIHLYRTALLDEARKYIAQSHSSLRPETFILRRMQELGYVFHQIEEEFVLGLHDYEQYYRDIYRKGFTHAHKHKYYVQYLSSFWQRMASSDIDYQVMMWGARDGLDFKGNVKIDVRDFSPDYIDDLLHKHALSEKRPPDIDKSVDCDIEHLLNSWKPPSEYWMCEYFWEASAIPALQRGRNLIKRTNWRTYLWFMSKRIGMRLTSS